jgi:hypothetical protein
MDMGFKIGVDPGTNTGLAIWEHGKLVDTMTVTMPSKSSPKRMGREVIVRSDSERLIEMERRLDTVFCKIYDSYHGADDPIEVVAVETFENHNSQFGAGRMLLCAQARAVAVLVANKYSKTIVDITKGSAPKTDADMFARVYGVPLDRKHEHERDAVHLSIISGFDKKGCA